MKALTAFVAVTMLALPGCSDSIDVNQQGEDMKAIVYETTVETCTQQDAVMALPSGLHIDFPKVCACGTERVFKDIPAARFAEITSEEEITALMQELKPKSEKALHECALELASK